MGNEFPPIHRVGFTPGGFEIRWTPSVSSSKYTSSGDFSSGGGETGLDATLPETLGPLVEQPISEWQLKSLFSVNSRDVHDSRKLGHATSLEWRALKLEIVLKSFIVVGIVGVNAVP